MMLSLSLLINPVSCLLCRLLLSLLFTWAESLSVAMGIKAGLPRYELYLYYAVLGLAMLWSASWICEVSSGELLHTSI